MSTEPDILDIIVLVLGRYWRIMQWSHTYGEELACSCWFVGVGNEDLDKRRLTCDRELEKVVDEPVLINP
jgi:hypothetical protein